MSEIAEPSAGPSHHVPVIDRMMEMLFVLEQRPDGATIRDLVEALGVPRTTVYRILNTLERHDVVRRSGEGRYRLGPRLLRLAARSIGDSSSYDLAAIAAPFLKSLSAETGEGSKISVVDGEGLLVVAAASGAREYALTVIPGQRLPLHAGAAGKTLLAHLPKDELDRRLSRELPSIPPAQSPIRSGSEPSLPASDDKGGRRTGASTPQAFMRSPRRSWIAMQQSLRRLAFLSSPAPRLTIWRGYASPSSQPPRRFPERSRAMPRNVDSNRPAALRSSRYPIIRPDRAIAAVASPVRRIEAPFAEYNRTKSLELHISHPRFRAPGV